MHIEEFTELVGQLQILFENFWENQKLEFFNLLNVLKDSLYLSHIV